MISFFILSLLIVQHHFVTALIHLQENVAYTDLLPASIRTDRPSCNWFANYTVDQTGTESYVIYVRFQTIMGKTLAHGGMCSSRAVLTAESDSGLSKTAQNFVGIGKSSEHLEAGWWNAAGSSSWNLTMCIFHRYDPLMSGCPTEYSYTITAGSATKSAIFWQAESVMGSFIGSMVLIPIFLVLFVLSMVGLAGYLCTNKDWHLEFECSCACVLTFGVLAVWGGALLVLIGLGITLILFAAMVCTFCCRYC